MGKRRFADIFSPWHPPNEGVNIAAGTPYARLPCLTLVSRQGARSRRAPPGRNRAFQQYRRRADATDVGRCPATSLRREGRIGGYETADEDRETLDHSYHAVAGMVKCASSEITFVTDATLARNRAFYSVRFSAGDRILVTLAEYGSNVVAYNHQTRRCGVETVFMPDEMMHSARSARVAPFRQPRRGNRLFPPSPAAILKIRACHRRLAVSLSAMRHPNKFFAGRSHAGRVG